jgi:hypothetical protein
MSLKLNSSGGGSVTLQEPTTASNVTLNLPAADGTVVYENASGNVGIGTSSPNNSSGYKTLSINGTTGGQIAFQTNSSGLQFIYSTSTDLNFYNSAAGNLIFHTNNTERARIDSSGRLLVGTTSGSYGARTVIQNNGTTTQPSISCINSTGSGTMRQIDFFTGSNTSRIGSIESTTSTTAYNTSSDYRLKNTITPMTGALAKVSQLKPVTYKWNIDGSNGQGFIAHELAEVCPDAVSGAKDAVDANGNPEYQGIDTSFLVATLTAAIQELKAEVDSLRAQVEAQ